MGNFGGQLSDKNVGEGNQSTLFSQTADKLVTNTVVETTLIGAGEGTVTLPANDMVAGSSYNLSMFGILSTTANPTLQIKAKLGATTIGDSGAVSMGNVTDQFFRAVVHFTVRSVGVSGTIIDVGLFEYIDPPNSKSFSIVGSSTHTIDTTGAQAVDLTVEWGTASASNKITSQVAVLEKTF